jgi:hypothetical protein
MYMKYYVWTSEALECFARFPGNDNFVHYKFTIQSDLYELSVLGNG